MGDNVRINYSEGMKTLSGEDGRSVKGLQSKKKSFEDPILSGEGLDDEQDHNLSSDVGSENDLQGPSEDHFIDTSNFN